MASGGWEGRGTKAGNLVLTFKRKVIFIKLTLEKLPYKGKISFSQPRDSELSFRKEKAQRMAIEEMPPTLVQLHRRRGYHVHISCT